MNVAILNKAGYFKRHFDLCLTEKSGYDAWEKVESEYVELAKELCLQRKSMFTSYESFRVAKTKYYQENR